MIRTLTCAATLAALCGCAPLPADLGAAGEPQVTRLTQVAAPPGAPPGSCWGRHVSPAVIETVTDQVLLHPAEVLADGAVARPAIYKTETVQRIVRERTETWFETPCPEQMTPEFVASVQRALAARGLYRAPVTGAMDARTRTAIRRYQAPEGPDSGILSLAAARRLGLVAVARDTG